MPRTQKSQADVYQEQFSNLGIGRTMVRKNGNKHLKLPVYLNWDINYFKLEHRLKTFFVKENIWTIKEVIEKYDELKIEAQNFHEKNKNTTLMQLVNFKKIIDRIIEGPPFPNEILSKMKKSIPGNGKRPRLEQQAFLNSLYFLESNFKKTKEFKKQVNAMAVNLKITKTNIFPYISAEE